MRSAQRVVKSLGIKIPWNRTHTDLWEFCAYDACDVVCDVIWVLSPLIWISHVTNINESCHIYEWVMSPLIWISHVTNINESGHICEWVLPHTYVDESCLPWNPTHADLWEFWTASGLVENNSYVKKNIVGVLRILTKISIATFS